MGENQIPPFKWGEPNSPVDTTHCYANSSKKQSIDKNAIELY